MKQASIKDIDPQLWEQTTGTWSKFVKFVKWGVLSAATVLVLMALFLL